MHVCSCVGEPGNKASDEASTIMRLALEDEPLPTHPDNHKHSFWSLE